MRSISSIELKERTTIGKQRTSKHNLEAKRVVVAPEISSRHSLFWNGVEGLMRIHKNSDFSSIKKKPDNVEFGISDKNHERLAELHIINPFGTKKVAWDIICGVALFYSIIEIPFRIGFRSTPSESSIAISYMVEVIFALDILLTFNTAIVDPMTDLLLADRVLIARKYASLWLWVDLASTIPFDLIVLAAVRENSEAPNVSTIRLIRVLRLVRLVKVIRFVGSKRIKNIIDKYCISPALVSIVSLMLQIFVVAHIVCCFWFFISTPFVTGFEVEKGGHIARTWVTEFHFADSDVRTQYIASLYWAFATMLTVGFGDIHATNTGERFYASMTMLLGALMFGAIIAKVRVLVESRNLQSKELKARVAEFKAYLEEKRIPNALRSEAKRMPSLAEGGLFDGLPNEMLYKLIRSSFHREIQAVDLFRKCDFQLLADIIVHGRPYRAEEGEVIYEMGDIADEVTFIIRGSVGMSVFGLGGVGGKSYPVAGQEDEEIGPNRILRTLLGSSTGGGYFGDLEYRKQSTRLARYHALETCTFLAIKFVTIRAAIEKNPVAGAAFLDELTSRYDVFEIVSRECVTLSSRTMPIPKSRPHSSTTRGPDSHGEKPTRERKDSSTYQSESYGHDKKPECEWVHTNSDSALWVDGKKETPKEAVKRNLSPDSTGHRRGVTSYLMVVQNRYGAEVLGEYTIQFLKSQYIFHPKDNFKIAWDAMIGGLTVYSVLTIPIQIAFYSATSTESGRNSMVFDYVVDLFFFADLLSSFNTAYFADSEDAYIAVRSRIVNTYFRSWFLVDLISCIPFDALLIWITYSFSTNLRLLQLVRIARLLRIIKLLRIVNFIKIFYRLEDMVNISPAFIGLCATLIKVVFIAHLLCCMWWGLSTDLTSHTWYDTVSMVYVPLRDAPFRDQYVASLYWTITTLSTVGYGDIVPIDDEERILAIFIMVLGATVFGYVVANVGTIVGNYNQVEAKAADRLTQMTEFMKEKNCSKGVVTEIINHFKHVYKHNSSSQEETILSRLPVRLRIELSFVQQKNILEKIPLFRYIKNTSLKLFLLHSMKSHFAGVERCILKEGEDANQIIFLIDGKCSVCKILNLPKTHIETAKWPMLKQQSRRERDVSSCSRKDNSMPPYLWNMHIRNKPFPRSPQRMRSMKRASSSPDVRTEECTSGGIMRCVSNISKSSKCGGNSTQSPRSPVETYEYPRLKSVMSSISSKLDLSGILLSKKASRVFNTQEPEAAIRARINWKKVKNLLPKIAAIQHVREDMVIDGYGTAQSSRKMESMHVLMEVRGHLERVLCDVRPLGTVTGGDFIGHTAMMDVRAYAASVVVSEPCHYFSLHRNDVLNLVREQPGIALELQSALAMAIMEDNRRAETIHRKKRAKWFLDDVKQRFETRQVALMTKRRKPFSKMILSLAVTAREKDTEKEEIKTRSMRNAKGSNEGTKAGTRKKGWKWFNTRSRDVSDKAREEKGTSESGVESLRAALKRGTIGLSSTLKSGRQAAAHVFDGKTQKNLSIFKIQDEESDSKKHLKSNTFWQGMVDLESGSRSAKIDLACRLSKLDRLQSSYLARVEECGSDGDDACSIFGAARSSRYLDQSGRGSEGEHRGILRYVSSSILCKRSRSTDLKSTRAAYAPTTATDPEPSTPTGAAAHNIRSASLLPLLPFISPSGLGSRLGSVSGSDLELDPDRGVDRHTLSLEMEYCGDLGPTFSPFTPGTVGTSCGVTPSSHLCDDVTFHIHGSAVDTVENDNYKENTEIDCDVDRDVDRKKISSDKIYFEMTSSRDDSEKNTSVQDPANRGDIDVTSTNQNIDVEEEDSTGERIEKQRLHNNKVSEGNDYVKGNMKENTQENTQGNSHKIITRSNNSKETAIGSCDSQLSLNKGMQTQASRLIISIPSAKDMVTVTRSISSYISLRQSSRLLSTLKFKQIREKKKSLKKHRSSSDLLDIRNGPRFLTQGLHNPSHSNMQPKCGSYVECGSRSFFIPPCRNAAMRRRKSFPSKDSEFWALQIVKRQII